GLLIVYGVLKIINLAHGAFLAVGAYAGVVTTGLGWNPWTALLVAFVIGVAGAALVEWRVLRGLYARPMDTILATRALNTTALRPGGRAGRPGRRPPHPARQRPSEPRRPLAHQRLHAGPGGRGVAPEPGAGRACSRRRPGPRQIVRQSSPRQPHHRDSGRDHPP